MTELLVVLILVLCNGFFAMSEMAVVTARKSRLKELAATSRRARVASELAEHPENFLSTVQVGITLIGILTGVFGGEAIGKALAVWLAESIPVLAPWSTAIGLGLSVALITSLSLVLGELVPKRFALTRPEVIAVRVALPMRALALLAAPAVKLLSLTTRGVLRLLRVEIRSAEKVSEDEIRLLVAESHEQGVIDVDERNMVNRVLRLGDRDAASLMTPRRRLAWLDVSASQADNLRVMRETPFSRYPVFRGSDQEVLGILEVKSLAGCIGGHQLDMFRTLRPALFVAEGTRALNLMDLFREEGFSLALVVDEYGDIQGMVTLNDLLGAVLGRLPGNDDAPDAGSPVVRRADGSLLVDASLPADELRDLLGESVLPDEEDHDYRTVAGLVIAHFGRIPQTGEFFDHGGWRFEVVDLDGARIDKLLLQRLVDDSAGLP